VPCIDGGCSACETRCERIEEVATLYRTAFPDLEVKIEEMVAESKEVCDDSYASDEFHADFRACGDRDVWTTRRISVRTG